MIDKYIVSESPKWWQNFLLLFKKTHYKHEYREHNMYCIKYKILFGDIYVLDDYLIGFDLY